MLCIVLTKVVMKKFAVSLFILGALLLVLASFLFNKDREVRQSSYFVDGFVIENIQGKTRRDDGVHINKVVCPKVKYILDNINYEFINDSCSRNAKYQIGEKVKVLANPQNQELSKIDSFELSNGPSYLLLAFFGLLLTGSSGWVLLNPRPGNFKKNIDHFL
jgi:hypothetical protein